MKVAYRLILSFSFNTAADREVWAGVLKTAYTTNKAILPAASEAQLHKSDIQLAENSVEAL